MLGKSPHNKGWPLSPMGLETWERLKEGSPPAWSGRNFLRTVGPPRSVQRCSGCSSVSGKEERGLGTEAKRLSVEVFEMQGMGCRSREAGETPIGPISL